jgi:hypothetical protein
LSWVWSLGFWRIAVLVFSVHSRFDLWRPALR